MHAQDTSLIQRLDQGGSVVTAATTSHNGGGHNGVYGASNAIDGVYLYCGVPLPSTDSRVIRHE